ncbi:MAG: hypothetical protein AM326_03005 [Candidatus Thorarchaeota archaeon SMTZ-45]|nr:MAG: hypothetical protein AM326_03005 [Candidatus Thorarchaeota archaeon SMTZ-45]
MAKWLGIGEESAYMTKGTATVWLDFISESVRASREFIEIQTVNERTPRFSIPGPFKSAGDIECLSNTDDLGSLLEMLLGPPDTEGTAQGTTGYKHTWNTIPNATLKSYTMEIQKEITTYEKLLYGAAIKSLTIDCPIADKVGVTASILAGKDKLETAQSPGTATTLKPLVYHQNDVSLFGSAAPWVESISVTMENGFDEDAFVQGDLFLPELILGHFKVTGTLDLRAKDWDAYQRFLGSASAVEPSAVVEEFEIQLQIVGEEVDTTPYYATLDMRMPKCHFTELEIPTEQRNRQVYTLPFEALYDDSESTVLDIELTNKRATTM